MPIPVPCIRCTSMYPMPCPHTHPWSTQTAKGHLASNSEHFGHGGTRPCSQRSLTLEFNSFQIIHCCQAQVTHHASKDT